MREVGRAAVVWKFGGRQPKMSEWEGAGWDREMHARSSINYYGA